MVLFAGYRRRLRPFGPLTVAYDDRILAPRAWTVMQSEWAAEVSPRLPAGRILELCAGAGHIGLLASSLTGRHVVHVEADPVAASFAVENAIAAGLADQVEVRVSTVTAAVGPEEHFPIVLADPPYLPTSQIDRWPKDPPGAIDGGADGLAVVKSCLHVIAEHLDTGGLALVQAAGASQVGQLVELLAVTPGLRRLWPIASRTVDDERAVLCLRAT